MFTYPGGRGSEGSGRGGGKSDEGKGVFHFLSGSCRCETLIVEAAAVAQEENRSRQQPAATREQGAGS